MLCSVKYIIIIFGLLELCRLKFSCSDCEFEKYIKDWFRHGYQRYKRDLEKKTVQHS